MKKEDLNKLRELLNARLTPPSTGRVAATSESFGDDLAKSYNIDALEKAGYPVAAKSERDDTITPYSLDAYDKESDRWYSSSNFGGGKSPPTLQLRDSQIKYNGLKQLLNKKGNK